MVGDALLRVLDLSPGGLLRSGSYIVLFAVAVLLWSRRRAHAWSGRLAAAYALSAVGGIGYNLIGANTTDTAELSRAVAVPTILLTAACSVAAGILWWPLAWRLLKGRGPRRAGLVAGGTLAALNVAGIAVAIHGGHWFDLEPMVYRLGLLLPITVGLVAAAEDARVRPGPAALFWAAAFPLWAEAMLYAGGAIQSPTLYSGLLGMLIFSAAPVMRLAATGWGLRAAGSSRTVLALVLVSLAIATTGSLLGDDGAARLGVSGVVLVGANVAALLLLRRHGLFGDASAGRRRVRLSKGMVASLGLAALFITAQVAQNFFSAKIGLYSGGIVAGAVVFVAYPLQRAAERAVERGRRGDEAEGGPLAIYRSQVELAWKDGRMGANERMMLRDLRVRLGLAAEEAETVDHDVASRHTRPRGARRRPDLGPEADD